MWKGSVVVYFKLVVRNSCQRLNKTTKLLSYSVFCLMSKMGTTLI